MSRPSSGLPAGEDAARRIVGRAHALGEFGVVKVSLVPFGSAICSRIVVNTPLTGWERVRVTGYGLDDPCAQFGTQPSSSRVPWPTASVGPQFDHASPVATLPASPEK